MRGASPAPSSGRVPGRPSRPRPSSRRSCREPCRDPATPAGTAASIPRRASSRRCASRSTRARCPRPRPRARGGPAAPRWGARRHQLPLAGGPHREADVRGRAPRLHLPTRDARVRLRSAASTRGRGWHQGTHAQRRRGRRQPTRAERTAARRPAARGMSGHRSSRRHNYGRRQKDVRDRRMDEMQVDLEGPSGWLRARGWVESDPEREASPSPGARRPGPSLGSASA